jgi:hypothetical protein
MLTPITWKTGAGAVYYEGASYDERVVPPAVRDMASRDAPPEREGARSRSGHRDHSTSAERRNRRREGESDRTRRRRDHRKRDTLDGPVDPTVPPSEPVLGGNALGFHPAPLRPGYDLYSSMPPAPPVTSDPSTSRARGGSFSRPSTSHGMAPPIAGTASVPGSAYRDASHSNGEGSFYSHRGDGSISRPSSTPNGPVLTPWTAPGFANPSMNSLGLSERSRDVSNAHPQAARSVSASVPPTARDSVSSWGTAESTSAHGDLFSTLRRLESAPADSGLLSNDLLMRPEGQLLGVVRAHSLPFHRPGSLTHLLGPLCANRDTATTATASSTLRTSNDSRHGQPLVLSPRTAPAFSVANVASLWPRRLPTDGTANFHSRESGIPLCLCATATTTATASIFSGPSRRISISYFRSQYPILVSLHPDAFDFNGIISLGPSPS